METRLVLATCIGEVGAIDENRLEDACGDGGNGRALADPPWHSAPHVHELQLVTSHLVVALKAAPTSGDQHKIAYTIQQLLDILNKAGEKNLLASPFDVSKKKRDTNEEPQVVKQSKVRAQNSSKPKMEVSLESKLADAGVLEIVEPFWFSEFHEVSPID
jgi:hypothetical protein